MSTGTQLLLTFDGSNGSTAITDSSANAFTMTHVGTLSALATSGPKFGAAAATWSAQQYAINGWYAPLTAGGPLDLHQTAFTVECWIKGTTQPNSAAIIFSDWNFSSSAIYRAYMIFSSGTTATVASQLDNSSSNYGPSKTATLLDGNWHHVVVSASSSQVGVAIDGVWGTPQSYAFDSSPAPGSEFYIGYDASSPVQGTSFIGSIDELRVSNYVVYPLGTTFTPPTAPFAPAITYSTPVLSASDPSLPAVALSWTPAYLLTSLPGLLLHFDGTNGQTAITDSSTYANVMTVAGYAALSTAAPKFGTAAGNFPSGGSEGWGTPLATGGPLDLHQFTWTIEFWVKFTSSSVGYLISTGNSGRYIQMYTNAGVIQMQSVFTAGSNGIPQAHAAANDGAWHHVACCVSATQSAIALDGVWNTAIAYSPDSAPAPASSFLVGYNPGGNGFVGQMDELRVVLGNAYTIGTNFTPPAAAFTGAGLVASADYELYRNGSPLALTTGGATTYADTLPALGTYVYQVYASNGSSNTGPGSNLVSVVFAGEAPVPNVANLSLPLATAAITSAGFVLGYVGQQYDPLTIPGNVDAQNPAAGTYAYLGTPVNVTLSLGLGPVVVPDVIGDTAAAATAAINTVGLIVNATSTAPSLLYPAGEVIAQNPQGGTAVAQGSYVSYVVSSGPPSATELFDFESTVISQYANSPTIQQLCANMNAYVDQTQNFANFYSFVWNIDTAEGFGLDILGRIVGVSRLLQIPTGALYVGFQDGTGPGTATDVQPFGQQGTWYTRIASSEAYLLDDGSYRKLILTKALSNIVNTTIPAFNQLLQNLFPGRGNPYVTTSGVMAMNFHFDFALTPIELAILEQSGAVPVPPGVSFTITTP